MHLKFLVEISDLENLICYNSGTVRAHAIVGGCAVTLSSTWSTGVVGCGRSRLSRYLSF
jgi:hypothetical protein